MDIAWAAGFIEGEGTFGASKHGGIHIAVCQIQLEPLERLQRLFGGIIKQKVISRYAYGQKNRTINVWSLYSRKAAELAMLAQAKLRYRRRDATA